MSTKWIVLGLRCQLWIQYCGVLLWWQVINSFDQCSAWSFSIGSSEIERIFFPPICFDMLKMIFVCQLKSTPWGIYREYVNMSYFVCGVPSANPSLGELFHGLVCHSIDHCRGSLSHTLAAAVGGSWVLSAGDGFRSWAELREGGHPVGLNWIWSPENYIIGSPFFLGNMWLYKHLQHRDSSNLLCPQTWLAGKSPPTEGFNAEIIYKWWIFDCHMWLPGGEKMFVATMTIGQYVHSWHHLTGCCLQKFGFDQ